MISRSHFLTHRRINDLLSVVVAGVGLYLLLLPVIPHIKLWVENRNDPTGGYTYQTSIVSDKDDKPDRKPIPKDNRLVLPTIQLDEAINEGQTAATLNKGLWRRPHTSTPDQGGNTVIVGHRFTYSDPSVLFHLDKIKEGDMLPLYWEGEEYVYKVTDVRIVSPQAVEIEHQTADPTLTIYTCTPVWTVSDRLVVRAALVEEAS